MQKAPLKPGPFSCSGVTEPPPLPNRAAMAGNLEPTAALSDALVILGAAGIVIPAFARFRITPIIGFIIVPQSSLIT